MSGVAGRTGAAHRLLLAPMALACVISGLVPFIAMSWAVARGLSGANPALLAAVQPSVMLALAATLPASLLGIAASMLIRPLPAGFRTLFFILAGLVLLGPAPAVLDWPGPGPVSLRSLAEAACAVARGTSLMLLATAQAASDLQPALRRSAQAAGATPWAAWRDAVLRPMALPVAGGVLLAFLVAFAQTRAAAEAAPQLIESEAWVLPAAAALAAGGMLGLARLLRR